MQKKFVTTRPKSDTNPTCVWIQLINEEKEVIQLKKYNNISLIAARQRAFGHCDVTNKHYYPKAQTAFVLRGGCDPNNPHHSDIWEDFTNEQGLKGFAPVPTIQFKLSAPV